MAQLGSSSSAYIRWRPTARNSNSRGSDILAWPPGTSMHVVHIIHSVTHTNTYNENKNTLFLKVRPKGDLENKMTSRSLSGIVETQAEPNCQTAKPGSQSADCSSIKLLLHPHGGLESDGHRGAIVQCGTFHRITLKGQLRMCSNMCVGANTASQHQQLGHPDLDSTRYITESGIRHFILHLPTRYFFGDRQASQNCVIHRQPRLQAVHWTKQQKPTGGRGRSHL